MTSPLFTRAELPFSGNQSDFWGISKQIDAYLIQGYLALVMVGGLSAEEWAQRVCDDFANWFMNGVRSAVPREDVDAVKWVAQGYVPNWRPAGPVVAGRMIEDDPSDGS